MKAGQPNDVTMFKTATRSALAGVRTALPGIVTGYDAESQRCSVKSAVRLPTADGNGTEELPELTEVPVAWQRGGGYFCAMPLEEGNEGLIIFCEADFTMFLETGEVCDPLNVRRHGLYAEFIPGGCSSKNPIVDVSPSGMVLGKDGGTRIVIRPDFIELGADATDMAANATKVQARLDALKSAIQGWTPVPNDGGAALKTALAGWLGGSNDVGAAEVKVK